jgi:aryl-alcohol dehydrogenase-like predicted oxidoreductase
LKRPSYPRTYPPSLSPADTQVRFKKVEDFAGGEADFRRSLPRYQGENLKQNLHLVEAFERIAAKKGCTPGQLSLAWVIAMGAIPIPGTKKKSRLEENFGASEVELEQSELREIRKVIQEAKPIGER